MHQLIMSNNSILRVHCPLIDPITAQELLVNAYIHRCWRTGGPIVITVSESAFEVQNPGELLPGLHPDSLIHCIPAYRNFLLAEGARFIGLCDKIGHGIDQVFRSALSGGFEFPIFESGNNHFTARLAFDRSPEFAEFVRRRSQALTNLDEILALRLLWAKENATLQEVAAVMQRSPDVARQILAQMQRRNLIERADLTNNSFKLIDSLRWDILHIFQSDQFDLFGEPIRK
ncbi:MAG: hypothetical protein HYS38_02135 [Acidobacteria bacterium]|nr:hypothetical protein [Acidobacteriota bacterium]